MAKKMGRPPKQGSLKSERVIIPVEPETKEKYRKAAERSGMDLAAWARLHLDQATENEK